MADENGENQDGTETEESVFPPPTFGPIGEEDNAATGSEPEGTEETASGGDGGADVETLRKELASLRESYDQQRQRDQEIIDRLIQGQSAQGGAAQEQSAEPVGFDDLPDPVDKPQEFKQALSQRFQKALEQREQQQSTQSQRQQALDALWNRFQQEHQDLSKRPAHVQGAAALESQELRQLGIDPGTYMQSNPDGFIARVAKRMRAELGDAGTPAGNETGTSEDKGRTTGVAGGSTSQGRAKSQPKTPGFIEQMKKAQVSDGLY